MNSWKEIAAIMRVSEELTCKPLWEEFIGRKFKSPKFCKPHLIRWGGP
jgi:hypothetical protein